jgi:hypothetical protein
MLARAASVSVEAPLEKWLKAAAKRKTLLWTTATDVEVFDMIILYGMMVDERLICLRHFLERVQRTRPTP